MNSSRFPGKVLAPLCGKPVLQHVLERCKQIAGVDEVVLAIPGADYLQLKGFAEQDDVQGFADHGSAENDVLRRYLLAAQFVNASTIMRITADCPLIDPDVCNEVLKLMMKPRIGEAPAYASNVCPRTFPQGLDCEVFSMAALEKANELAVTPYDREHVTPLMQKGYCGPTANYAQNFDASHVRWTVDYPEDIARLEQAMKEAA